MVTNKENKETETNLKEDFVEKVDKNPKLWKITSLILGSLCLILLVIAIRGNITGQVVLNEEDAAQNFVDFAKAQGIDIEILSIEDTGNFYEVTALIMNNVDSFSVTKDGQYLIGGLVPLTGQVVQETSQTQQPTQTQETSQYSQEDLIKLKGFNDCLAESGIKIYGANWCGYTIQWVDELGGFGAVSPIYVECTEEQALCQSEGIQGYPTIKINGQAYSGARTVEAIAQVTGCTAPVLDGNPTATTATASCS